MAVPILRLNVDDNPRIIVKQDNMPVIVTGNTYWNFTGSGATTVVEDAHGNIVDVTIYSPIVDTSTFIGVDTFSAYTATTIADIQNAVDCCTGLTETFNTYTADTFNTLSGLTWAGIVLQAQVNGLENAFESHTGDTTIHFPFSDVTDAIASATSGITATSAWSGLTGYPTDNADLNAILTGMTADILANTQCCTGNTADIEYHYQQFTGFTDYVYTLIVPAITGNTADISYLSGQTEIAQKCCTGLTATFNDYTGDTFITLSGITVAGALLQAQVNNLEAAFTGHTGQTGSGSIHFTGHTFTQSGITVITQVGDNVNIYVPADAITGITWGSITGTLSGQTDLQAALDLKLDNSVYQGDMLIIAGEIDGLISGLTTHTGDTSIHYAQSAITITESQISDLKTYLTGVTFNDITGDVSGNTNLQNALDLKLDNSVYQGDMLIISGEIDDLITGVTANTASTIQNANDIDYISGVTNSHYQEFTGHTHSQYLTGFTVTCDMVTGCTDGLYLPITGLTGYWTSAQTESYVTGLGYITGYTVTADDVTGITASLYSPIGHTHPYSAITDTPDLNAYALSGHTHAQYLTGITCSDVTGCTDGLYAPIVHTHEYSGLTGLPDLNAYALSGHTHPQYLTGYTVTAADVTGITATLYSLTGHTHTGVYVPFDTSIVSVTGATTLNATHQNKIIEASGTFTVTLPNSMPTGYRVDIINVGTGTITLAASTTLQSDGTKLKTQYTGASAYHRGSNVWIAVGKLTT